MEQSSLPSNSLMNANAKEEKIPNKDREKLQPIKGKAKKKKKTLGERIVSNFVSDDIDDIPGFIKKDVIIPVIKKTAYDTLGYIFFGRTSNKTPTDGGIITNYNAMSRGRGNVYFLGSSAVSEKKQNLNRRTFNDLYFEESVNGDIVWNNIKQILGTYSNISIAEILELSGLEKEIDFPDWNYGWTNIVGMGLVYDGKGGATLKLPPARLLDQ